MILFLQLVFTKKDIARALTRILNIIKTNTFKTVAIFDNYDYDYDPNIVIDCSKMNILFFKRNYSSVKKYKSNVVPFPFIMF